MHRIIIALALVAATAACEYKTERTVQNPPPAAVTTTAPASSTTYVTPTEYDDRHHASACDHGLHALTLRTRPLQPSPHRQHCNGAVKAPRSRALGVDGRDDNRDWGAALGAAGNGGLFALGPSYRQIAPVRLLHQGNNGENLASTATGGGSASFPDHSLHLGGDWS